MAGSPGSSRSVVVAAADLELLGHRDRAGRPGHRHRHATAVAHTSPVVGAAQPGLETCHGLVERTVEVGGAALAAHHGTATAAGDLHALAALRLAGVRLVGELDLHPHDLVVIALETRQLVGHVLAEVLGNLDVASTENGLQDDLPIWGNTMRGRLLRGARGTPSSGPSTASNCDVRASCRSPRRVWCVTVVTPAAPAEGPMCPGTASRRALDRTVHPWSRTPAG